EFHNLKGRQKNAQIADGGLSFYNTSVEISHSSFNNIKAKDAINFIKSNYTIEHCRFNKINGDAIDANNSVGKLTDLEFNTVGKDALEFSGGTASIRNVSIDNANASGINSSRNAIIECSEILSIANSKTGIKASDLASVKLDQTQLKNVENGFVLYQDLANYGGANLTVKKYEGENVNSLHKMDNSSKLEINGKTISAN
ncbi:MAG: hypothetical protein AAGK97_11895, partial [Bacteroidota bacterium]